MPVRTINNPGISPNLSRKIAHAEFGLYRFIEIQRSVDSNKNAATIQIKIK